MSTCFALIYLTAIVAILLGISGFIMLIYGLINKQKKLTITGSIFSFLAILIIVFGILFSVRKFVRFAIDAKKQMHMRHYFRPNPFCMPMDARFMSEDSLYDPNDSGKVSFEKRIIIRDHMKFCNPNIKCDPAKCKHKCQHHQ